MRMTVDIVPSRPISDVLFYPLTCICGSLSMILALLINARMTLGSLIRMVTNIVPHVVCLAIASYARGVKRVCEAAVTQCAKSFSGWVQCADILALYMGHS